MSLAHMYAEPWLDQQQVSVRAIMMAKMALSLLLCTPSSFVLTESYLVRLGSAGE